MLQRGFAKDSVFWQEHQYFEPETPFSSYLYNLVRQEAQVVMCLLLQQASQPCSRSANISHHL